MKTVNFNGVMITEEQWYKFCDAGGGRPMALAAFDLTKPFVFFRKYGIFPVNHGHHQQVMALLYAWEHDYHCPYDMIRDKKIREISTLADAFLEELDGTAFRSSVGKKVVAGKRTSLTTIEKRKFGEISYTME
jgi:hypothetical protein